MIKVILIMFFSFSSAIASENNYWAINLPVINGATNISHEKDEKLYIKRLTYNLPVKDTQIIYDFYDKFFSDIGWENPMKKHSTSKMNNIQGKWSSYRSAYNEEGKPFTIYASMWKSENTPAVGQASLKLIGFKEGIFDAEISIAVSPEIDSSPLFKLQNIMMANPVNIFILYDAVKGNPFEIDKIKLSPSGKYKDHEVVKNYYELVNKILNQYREFGTKYVKK